MDSSRKLILLQDLGMQYPINSSKNKYRYGLYQCYCGKEFRTMVQSVTVGDTVSCGCYNKSMHTHHGLRKHPLYHVWNSMKDRCLNPRSKKYSQYGGRGVTLYYLWKDSFLEFYTWAIEEGYTKGLSIDRINVNGSYEPSNCRWATKLVQAQNTRLLTNANTSGYRGVTLRKSGAYQASIGVNSKLVFLGNFTTAEDVARAYDAYAISNNTAHPINFPKEYV